MSAKFVCKVLLKLSVLLFIPTAIAKRQSSLRLVFKSYYHEYNTDFFKSNLLQLVNYTDHMAFDGCVVFSRDIDVFAIRLEATVLKPDYSTWTLMNVTVDGCPFIASSAKKSLKLLYQIVGAVRVSSQRFPNKCPMEKDREYCFTNVTLNSIPFPPYFLLKSIHFSYALQQNAITMFKGYFELEIQAKDNK